MYVRLLGQVGSGSNAAIAVAASRAIGATLEVINILWIVLKLHPILFINVTWSGMSGHWVNLYFT